MPLKLRFAIFILLVFPSSTVFANEAKPSTIDSGWLLDRLENVEGPRLIWREGLEERVREAVAKDQAATSYYSFIMTQADGILDLPLPERELQGRRLLQVSRNALKRLVYLSFAWRMTGEENYLNRLEEILGAVCSFEDWNPSHFLDTAEMSLGVALAVDWVGEDLDLQVLENARIALFEHGLVPAKTPEYQWAFTSKNNWNQVCNAGMVAAALVLAEEYPEEAVLAINRMIENLPSVLNTYGPDGVYVEGAMYWGYGTQFNVVLFDILDTALGTRFDLDDVPGFLESADFVFHIMAPSGRYYDFYDSDLSGGYMPALSWFAKEAYQLRYLQRKETIALKDWDLPPSSLSGRLLPVEFIWFLDYQGGEPNALPLNWVGRGENPIGVFRSSHDDPNALYLAFKGGKATNGHGNMDAGSFILELDGVRWAIDMGNQSYSQLEAYFAAHGGTLWSSEQESARWKLLTKSNFGHSTLTVGDALHCVDGLGVIESFDAEQRTAVLDLSQPLGENVQSALRTFSVVDDRAVEVSDRVVFAAEPQKVVWQMTTLSEVTLQPRTATLRQNGKTLRIQILEPIGVSFSVVSLDVPPHPADKVMEGLKRLEIVVPAYAVEGGEVRFKVRLQGTLN